MPIRSLIVILLFGLLLSGCGSSRKTTNAVRKSAGVSPRSERLSPEACERFDELFYEAMRQHALEQYDAEYELLNEALLIDKNSPEAVFEAGMLSFALSRGQKNEYFEKSDSLILRAITLSPDNLFYKQVLSQKYASQGKMKEAAALLEQVAAKKPEVYYFQMLQQMYEAASDVQGAIASVQHIQKIRGIEEASSVELYQYYIQIGDEEHAFKAIEDLCAAYPTNLRYRVLLGDLYQQTDHNSIALATYKDVLHKEPDNGYAQMSLLAYYKKQGQEGLYFDLLQTLLKNSKAPTDIRTEALKVFAIDNLNHHGDSTVVINLFEEALKLPQTDRSILELYSQYLTSINAGDDMIRPVIERILEVEPDHTKSRLIMLAYVIKDQVREEILETCKKGRQYDASQAIFYLYEGMQLNEMGQTAEALQVLRTGTRNISQKTDREVASDLFAVIGDIEHELGNYDLAFEAYDSSLVYNSVNTGCLNNYAYYLSLQKKNLDKAEEMSEITIKSEPNNIVFLDTYAWILFCNGKYEQARIFMDEIFKLSDEGDVDFTYLEHAGDIYFKCRLRKEALEYWKRAVEKAENNKDKRRVQRKIQRKRI